MDREGRRFPARSRGVAHRAICRDRQGYVVRIGGLVKICGMAARTGVGRIREISVVTGIAVVLNGNVCAGKRIDHVVIKIGGHPGRFAVAGRTFGWELGRCVVRAGGRVVIRDVTACTGVRRAVVVPSGMTSGTIIGYGGVRSVQSIIIAVDRETCRRPTRGRRMAHGAIRRKA